MKKLLIALERRTLKAKLLLGFVVLMGLAVVIGIDALVGQRRLSNEFRQMYEKELLGISAIKEARFEYAQIGRTVRMVILSRDSAERDRALKLLVSSELAMNKAIAETRERSYREEGKRQLAKFEENYTAYRRNVDRAVAMAQKGQMDEARDYVSSIDFQRPGIAANENLAAMAKVKEDGAKEAVLKGDAVAEYEEFTTLFLLVGGAVLGLLFGLLIARSIRQPTLEIRESVEQLARGHLDQKVPHTDYPNEVGDLARAIEVLQTEARLMEAQRWIKSHIAEISGDLQQATSFTDLSKVFLARIAPLIKLGHGVFYIYEEDHQRMRLLGGYAYRERKNLDQYFNLGQGLVGQCALERAPIFITEPPEDYVRIGSSLGEGVPRSIALLPILRNERLLAILELATFDAFGANEQALLDGITPILAMSLEILERNVKTKQLLTETQRQAENMEKQAARLEEQAVEMEAQQYEIKAAEERSRLILGSVKDGIVGLDNNGMITFANASSYLMLGHTEEEFLGQQIHGLVHHHYPDGSDFPRQECAMYRTTQDGQSRTVDNEVLWHKNGTAIPV
jgi:two-component system sensor histidine kinase/response regulator